MHPPGTPRSPYTLTPLHHWPLTAVLAVQARAYRPELIESAHTLAHKIAATARREIGRASCRERV